MKKEMYARLQMKRAWKLYPSILAITVVTVSVILLVGVTMLGGFLHGEDKQKFHIGIVGDVTDSYLGIGITALQNMDSSRFSFTFMEMEEEEAQEALRKQEIFGYVHAPENFIDNIMNGENVPATFVTLGGAERIGTVLTGEVAEMVSDIVTECQRSMYAMQDAARAKGKTDGLWEKVKAMNIRYIEDFLFRTSSYEVENLGIANSVSMGGYYICGMVIFFLLLWGISSGRFMMGRSVGLQKQLLARGMSVTRQIFCEYFAFLALTFLTVFLFSVGAGFLMLKNIQGIPELSGATFFTPMRFVFTAIPVILMVTAMQTAMYEMTSGTVSSILLQFIVAIGMGYISGCLYPSTFFPETVQHIGTILPSGVGFSYLRQSMLSVPDGRTWMWLLIYTAAFLGITVWIRKCRMAGDGQ